MAKLSQNVGTLYVDELDDACLRLGPCKHSVNASGGCS